MFTNETQIIYKKKPEFTINVFGLDIQIQRVFARSPLAKRPTLKTVAYIADHCLISQWNY